MFKKFARKLFNLSKSELVKKPRKARRFGNRNAELESRVMLISFVDANNDGVFNTGDVELNQGELLDGVFSTDFAEGGYTTAIQGAGLVIGDDLIFNKTMNYNADGDIRINANVKTNKGVRFNTTGNILVGAVTIEGKLEVALICTIDLTTNAQTVINYKEGCFFTTGGKQNLSGITINKIKGGVGLFDILAITNSINLSNAKITGKTNVEIETNNVNLGDLNMNNIQINIAGSKKTNVDVVSLKNIQMNDALISAGNEFSVKAADDIGADTVSIRTRSKTGKIKPETVNNFDLDNSTMRAFLDITVLATSNTSIATLLGVEIAILDGSNSGTVNITSNFIFIAGAEIVAPVFPVITGTQNGTATFIGIGTRP